MKKILFILTIVCLMLTSLASVTVAHKGRTDSYGGHNNRAMGTYHFHSGPLSGQEFASKAEAINALNSNTRVSSSVSTKKVTYNGETLVGSAKSNKYHNPNCRWAQKIKKANLVNFLSLEDAKSKGYVPCKVCHTDK